MTSGRLRARGGVDAGWTLTEMLVVIVLFGLIGAIVTTASISGLHQQTKLQDRSDVLAQARAALERIDRDVRSANPLLAASSTQLVVREVEPTVTRTVTYSVSNNTLTARESDTTSAGVTTTSSAVLLGNLANSAASPIFSVSPVLGYAAPSGSGVTSATCAMSGGYDPGCIGTVTVHLLVRPSASAVPISLSDNGTDLRNAP